MNVNDPDTLLKISKRNELDIRIHDLAGSDIFSPLDRLTIELTAGAGITCVRVLDSFGKRYFEQAVIPKRQEISFQVRGALGRHKIQVRKSGQQRFYTGAEFIVDVETYVRCDGSELGDIYSYFKTMVMHDIVTLMYDDQEISMLQVLADLRAMSIRDHTHALKGYKYWLKDIRGVPELFLRYQKSDGGIYDFLGSSDSQEGMISYAKKLFAKEFRKILPDKGIYFANLPKEADTPYLIVECAYRAWQACGDDNWIRSLMPRMEKALLFVLKSDRWFSKKHGLVQRPFTIDTWDFEFCPSRMEKEPCSDEQTTFQRHFAKLKKKDIYCIMHGDQSGMYQACLMLSRLFKHFGMISKAGQWTRTAKGFRARANALCWNGRFYKHQVFLKKPSFTCRFDEDAEPKRLSLSNPYDINRGLATHEQAVSIIREYQSLRTRLPKGYPGEWVSIYPSYRMFNCERKMGEYVNGGVTGIVAGELAKAAFDHGAEEYGVDILRRYYRFIRSLKLASRGTPYGEGHSDHIFFHVMRGKVTSCDIGPRGWPVTAILYALVEGLAGIEDKAKLYEHIKLSPRWIRANVRDAKCCARYAASEKYCAYNFFHLPKEKTIRLELSGSFSKIEAHVLLPNGSHPARVTVNGKGISFQESIIEKSTYVDFQLSASAQAVEIRYIQASSQNIQPKIGPNFHG